MKTVPLLLEFTYERVIRPSDSGTATDTRLLAVAYHSFSVKSAATGEVIAHFDLAGKTPPGFYTLYGLSHPESWGIWSEGTRSCVVLDVPSLPDSGYAISIDHHIPRESRAPIGAKVRANGRPAGEVEFCQDEVEFTIRQEDGFEAIAAAASSNVSLSLSPAPAVSIVVVNYNRPDLTKACILSVLASQTNAPYEIVVIDNASDPAAFSALASADLPIRITRLDDRRSFGEANNVAAERAHGAYILLLNNDAFVGPSCIDELLSALGDDGVGAAGPIFEDCEGRLQEAGCSINADGNVLLRDHTYFVDVAELPAVSPVEHISAACLMMRKRDFVALGGFDPVYDPAYHEDVDLCCRMAATGKSIALVREARSLHIRNATVKTLSASDPFLAAPERSLHIFRSRWGSWLWSRDPREAPQARLGAAKDAVPGTEPFEGRAVNAILFDPSEKAADLAAGITIAGALGRSHPALFCTRTPYSSLRLRRLIGEASLPAQNIAIASEQSLTARDIEVLVHSSSEIPPVSRELGQRRIWHCPMPVRVGAMSDSETRMRLEALERITAIVTGSEIAKRKLLGALSYIGAPCPPVRVVRMPIVGDNDVRPEDKQNLVLSLGPFRSGPSGGGHDVVLRSFRRLQADPRYNAWQLICLGEMEWRDDVAYYKDFSFRAAARGVRCLTMPSPQQRDALLRRAKICVSTNNWGGSSEQDDAPRLYRCGIGDALRFGVIPVVYAQGVEAELCEHLGLSFMFHHVEDIEEQTSLAAVFANSGNLAGQMQGWRDILPLDAFYRQWDALLGDTQGAARALAAV